MFFNKKDDNYIYKKRYIVTYCNKHYGGLLKDFDTMKEAINFAHEVVNQEGCEVSWIDSVKMKKINTDWVEA